MLTKEIQIKKYVIYLFGICIALFMLNKLFFRNWILKNNPPEFLKTITLSIPNLIEAIIVTLLLTGILLQIRKIYYIKLKFLKTKHLHFIASGAASVYVISQELKFHNLGGNNVYDPNDLIASAIGLIGILVIIYFFGFAKDPEIESRN